MSNNIACKYCLVNDTIANEIQCRACNQNDANVVDIPVTNNDNTNIIYSSPTVRINICKCMHLHIFFEAFCHFMAKSCLRE